MKCCVCGKLLYVQGAGAGFSTDQNGQTVHFHKICYEGMCKGEHRVSSKVDRPVSRS